MMPVGGAKRKASVSERIIVVAVVAAVIAVVIIGIYMAVSMLA